MERSETQHKLVIGHWSLVIGKQRTKDKKVDWVETFHGTSPREIQHKRMFILINDKKKDRL
ncbi:hypothetical protein [Dactylococcopsis salina]|uniref:hypothetical protein n=1 Tax=Dactylococcopsis salina TaxID=292566 RepID=UPI00059C155F|nr:hypothetical protein [Dactylococcopsis salina]